MQLRPGADPAAGAGFLLGLCFALGYGITQRLIQLQFSTAWSGHQRFEVKPFPGTELNSLRRKVNETGMEIRGDLDLLELERQQTQESAAIEARREAMAEREQQLEAERQAEAAADPAAELPSLPEPPALPPAPEPDPGPLLQPSPNPAATRPRSPALICHDSLQIPAC